MKELSVGAITFLEKKVLLIHQINGNHIGFPKGHIEINESPEKTALREVYEETGIKIKLESLSYSIKYKLKSGINKEVIYFCASALNNKIRIQTKEIHNAFWLEIDEALQKLTYDNDKKALKYFSKKFKAQSY